MEAKKEEKQSNSKKISGKFLNQFDRREGDEPAVKTTREAILEEVLSKREGDIFIVNSDAELTGAIQQTFERHGCRVSVTQLESNLVALYVLLNKKISMKKLRKLMEKGQKVGLEFFLTRTGINTSLLRKIQKFFI